MSKIENLFWMGFTVGALLIPALFITWFIAIIVELKLFGFPT